ncbi:hypothetical protein DAEQUDRAFT_661052 [Daedalea quercina L-15889]|uniref:RlpA-like protein double-psi beta-barrel domain-containing protein n=1 Tax=Daedalea quercina L-15889 TaxID=1314783 RepID=A0A165TZA2_9APHY|nr:hypothetical protein DAEQUDRAFT_661052 [Daedalea quercina L-15889]
MTLTTIERRIDGARLTYYDAGQNACGGYDSDGDFVVALNAPQWDNGAHCYETITIWYGGKSTQAKITDMCPGCPYGGLDLSRGLFGFLADLGLGVLTASWDFGNGGNQQPQADLQEVYTPYTVYAPSSSHDAPSTTYWAPTSTFQPTSTFSSPMPFSSYSNFNTVSATFSSYALFSSSSMVSTTSTTPSATATSVQAFVFDKGTLDRVNLAIVGLSGLVEAANYA